MIEAGKSFQQQLVDWGIVPKLCRRVVIDIPCDGIVRVYYETVDSKKYLEPDLLRNLRDAAKINVEDVSTDAKTNETTD